MDAATSKKRSQRFDLNHNLYRIASNTQGVRFLIIIPDKQIVWHSQVIAKRISFAKLQIKRSIGKMSSFTSKRAQKRAAMNRFKNNRRNGFNVLDDDAGHFKEEEDVYDLVDQDEYRNLVESRRQREDFVVDDGRFLIDLKVTAKTK